MDERTPDLDELAKLLDASETTAQSGTFEDALGALESIVRLLEQGNIPLAESVRCFEVGTRLSERCQQLLEEAELRISMLAAAPEYDGEDADPWMVEGN